jgi:hypothetical protein
VTVHYTVTPPPSPEAVRASAEAAKEEQSRALEGSLDTPLAITFEDGTSVEGEEAHLLELEQWVQLMRADHISAQLHHERLSDPLGFARREARLEVLTDRRDSLRRKVLPETIKAIRAGSPLEAVVVPTFVRERYGDDLPTVDTILTDLNEVLARHGDESTRGKKKGRRSIGKAAVGRAVAALRIDNHK